MRNPVMPGNLLQGETDDAASVYPFWGRFNSGVEPARQWSHARAFVARERITLLWIAALTIACVAMGGALLDQGYELPSPWAFVALALVTAAAERQSVRVARNVETSVAFLPFVFSAVAYGPLGALSVGLMVSPSANPCVYALTMDMGGRNLGVVFATMNMAGNLGSWAFTRAVPLLVGRGGWDTALAVFAGLHIFAAVCWLLINPNGTIGERPPAPLPEQEP